MNMPFEFGIDMGFRRSSDKRTDRKKFIIFEKEQYDLKKALSDLAGSDVEFHRDDLQLVIKKLRNFAFPRFFRGIGQPHTLHIALPQHVRPSCHELRPHSPLPTLGALSIPDLLHQPLDWESYLGTDKLKDCSEVA